MFSNLPVFLQLGAKMKWHWQYLVPPSLFLLSVDFVILPALKGWGFAGWTLFALVSIASIIELLCSYFFWKWFRKTSVPEFAKKAAETAKVKEAIELGREIHNDLREAYLWEKIKMKILRYCFGIYDKTTSEDSRPMRWIKRGGNIAMFILGISPEPGTRVFGTICCGVTGWKNGLYPLALGNVMRVAYMIGIWNIIFNLFG